MLKLLNGCNDSILDLVRRDLPHSIQLYGTLMDAHFKGPVYISRSKKFWTIYAVSIKDLTSDIGQGAAITLYSSLETQSNSKQTDDDTKSINQVAIDTCNLLDTIHKKYTSDQRPTMIHGIHEIFYKALCSERLKRGQKFNYKSVAYQKFIFQTVEDAIVPDQYKISHKPHEKDILMAIGLSEVTRVLPYMSQRPCSFLYTKTHYLELDREPLAWIYSHQDGSIGTLYVQDAVRRQGIALMMAKIQLKECISRLGYSHCDVGLDNVASLAVARGNGGRPLNTRYWLME